MAPLLTASQVFSTAEVPRLSHRNLGPEAPTRRRNLGPSLGRHPRSATSRPWWDIFTSSIPQGQLNWGTQRGQNRLYRRHCGGWQPEDSPCFDVGLLG